MYVALLYYHVIYQQLCDVSPCAVCFQVSLYCMFSGQMAFYAKVSDPAIGGTYMTLLNTMSNLGESPTPTRSHATRRSVCSFFLESCIPVQLF